MSDVVSWQPSPESFSYYIMTGQKLSSCAAYAAGDDQDDQAPSLHQSDGNTTDEDDKENDDQQPAEDSRHAWQTCRECGCPTYPSQRQIGPTTLTMSSYLAKEANLWHT
jgi:hypothetical protein